MRRLFPYKKIATLLLLLTASVFLMNVTGKPQEGPSFWESLLLRSMRPFAGFIEHTKDWYTSLATTFKDKESLLKENEELLKELARLQAQVAGFEDIHGENARLKELLDLKDDMEQEYIIARVIGRNPSKWFSTVVISAGSHDGVFQDAAVMSLSGLVGRVISCDPHSSVVLLLTDPESGAGALVSRSRDAGVIEGGYGEKTVLLRFFSKDADVVQGDAVFTSGLGSKYPPGMLVGHVLSVHIPQPGLVKEALVVTATDFEHLEEVLVMINE